MNLHWFRRPSAGDAGTLNLCFELVDTRVVHGAADVEALPGVTYSRLLEDVSALAGVVRGFGVVPGDRVCVTVSDPADELRAVLAVVRLGAIPVHDPTRVALTDGGIGLYEDGVFSEDPMDWTSALRLGRTDPAECEPQPADSAWGDRTVLQVAQELADRPQGVLVGVAETLRPTIGA